jgi:hypothetical protein
MATIVERVAAGVALLDRTTPGWDTKISLADLRIESPCDCVCGQVFGNYDLRPEESQGNKDADYGFEAASARTDSYSVIDVEYEYAALNDEWRRVVAGRRLARKEVVLA